MPRSPNLAPNLSAQITTHLRQRILAGEVAAGSSLLEIPLAQEFGTSRGPIRDAFLALSKEGLLTAKPNIGVRVAEAPSPFKRKVLVELRRDIETACLLEGFSDREKSTPHLARLEENLQDFKIACQRGALGPVVELDMAFHRLLVESADNRSLVNIWLPIILQMFLRYSRHRALSESYEEHAAIVTALKGGRVTLAASRLGKHIL
jgi:DNA-binding GntR family transcriptional regulator